MISPYFSPFTAKRIARELSKKEMQISNTNTRRKGKGEEGNEKKGRKYLGIFVKLKSKSSCKLAETAM